MVNGSSKDARRVSGRTWPLCGLRRSRVLASFLASVILALICFSQFDVLRVKTGQGPVIALDDLSEKIARESFRLKLVVFTCDRLESLKRLSMSLLRADYSAIAGLADLQVQVDYCPRHQDSIRSFLANFTWPHGAMSVNLSERQKGLRDSVLSGWIPKNMDEFAVFLEDDIEVSPSFVRWLTETLQRYYYGHPGPVDSNRLMSIALYAPIYSEALRGPFEPRTTDEAYLSQLPCSWGALFTPYMWRQFLNWFEDNKEFDPLVPDLGEVNSWPASRSWKRFLARFMSETGAYVVYPNVGHNRSFSTNHVELGVNMKDPQQLAVLRQRFTVDLVQIWRPSSLPSIESMIRYDIYENELQTGIKTFPQPHWQDLSGFTVVIAHGSGDLPLLRASVEYWLSYPKTRALVVRSYLNERRFDGSLLCSGAYQVPCRVESISSHHALLKPVVGAGLAIFIVDAAIRIGYELVNLAFHVFHMFPRTAVGFRGCAGGLQWDGPNVSFTAPVRPEQEASLVLTKAMFLRSSYLLSYWEEEGPWKEARDIVEKTSCEADLLLNVELWSWAPPGVTSWLLDGHVEGCANFSPQASSVTPLVSWVKAKGIFNSPRSAIRFPGVWMADWRNKTPLVAPSVTVPSSAGLQ